MFLLKKKNKRIKQNQHYRVTEYIRSKKQVIVQNYKTGQKERYSTVLSKIEILVRNKRRYLKYEKRKKKIMQKKITRK